MWSVVYVSSQLARVTLTKTIRLISLALLSPSSSYMSNNAPLEGVGGGGKWGLRGGGKKGWRGGLRGGGMSVCIPRSSYLSNNAP